MATQGINVSQEQVEANKGKESIPEPCIVVIFGASGDLTKRKLLPALYHLDQQNLLPENFAVVGVARRDLSKTFAPDMKDGIIKGGGVDENEPKLAKFIDKVQYFATEFDSDDGYENLKKFLADLDGKFGTKGNRLFYLAVAPEFFADITKRLGKHGMTGEGDASQGWVRVIIEKPFGTDLESAKKLNTEINAVLHEDQIFRIDHYLGKETVQNILVFRFGNGIFEPLWNRNYIDNVQITAAESIGIEGRGPFYEAAGALRDVLQNHVMEVLSFGQYGPGTVDGEQVKGYREEDRVSPESQTETYAAMKLSIENWRWAGVPFYIRAAKRLERRVTEVVITFKQPPLHLFKSSGQGAEQLEPNVLTLRIQPDDGIKLRFGAKIPGPTTNIAEVEMNFSYAESFGKSSANGYERLLLDAMLGDGTLFAEREGVETTWALMTPILEAWKQQKKDFPNYAAGSWGPQESHDLLERDGREWRVS